MKEINCITWFITSGLASRGSHLLADGVSSEAAIAFFFFSLSLSPIRILVPFPFLRFYAKANLEFRMAFQLVACFAFIYIYIGFGRWVIFKRFRPCPGHFQAHSDIQFHHTVLFCFFSFVKKIVLRVCQALHLGLPKTFSNDQNHFL